jgi:DNA-binding CsgD family transcriptional regulator
MRRGRPPYPGILTPREQEVLALLREGLSNPEIAERLGITRAGAAFHVGEILSKLQVHSREEAAAWTPESEAGRRRVPLPAFLAMSLRRLTSSAVMRFAAAGAIAVAAVAFGLLTLGVIEMRGRQPAPAAEPTPPAQAGAEPTAEPETLDSPLSGPISDGFTRRDLAPDETPDETHGIALVDVATGEGELWSVAVSEGDFVVYDASPDHRWLVALASGPSASAVIADRETAREYRLDWEAWQVVAGPSSEGLLLLGARDGLDLRLVDLATDPTGPGKPIAVPSLRQNRESLGVFLGNGERALVDGHVIDLRTGALVRTIWHGDATAFSLTRLADGGALALAFTGDRADSDISTFRVDAAGNITGQQVFFAQGPAGAGFGNTPSSEGVSVSPDGHWLAWQSRLALGSVPFSEYWPAVVIADLQSGEVVARVVRASIREGATDFQSLARPMWLSDSSGLLLKTPGGSAVLRVPDGRLEPLAFDAAPVPAHHNRDVLVHAGQLVALDGSALGEAWGIGAWPLGDPLDRVGFSDDGSEVRFVKVIPPGRDWAIHILHSPELPAFLQRPPFIDALRVAVAADGDGLNLRATPSADAAVVAALPDGTLASIVSDPEEVWGVTTSSVPDQAEIDAGEFWWRASWWVHIRTEAGLEGWVRAAFLAWAD